MRAVLTSGLLATSLVLSPSAFAASGTLDSIDLGLGTGAKILAALTTLALLYVLKSRPRRMVKMDAAGRRYDPTVRGLFED